MNIRKLELVLSSLRFQNSGADIHTVGNIRNTASLLKQELEEGPDCISDELIRQMVKNVENDLVQFYMRKYPGRHV